MTPELVTSLGSLLAGLIGAATALVLALRKRISEEEVPELRRRNAELEDELVATRQDVVASDFHIYSLERLIAQGGGTPPERPARLASAVHRARGGRRTKRDDESA